MKAKMKFGLILCSIIYFIGSIIGFLTVKDGNYYGRNISFFGSDKDIVISGSKTLVIVSSSKPFVLYSDRDLINANPVLQDSIVSFETEKSIETGTWKARGKNMSFKFSGDESLVIKTSTPKAFLVWLDMVFTGFAIMLYFWGAISFSVFMFGK